MEPAHHPSRHHPLSDEVEQSQPCLAHAWYTPGTLLSQLTCARLWKKLGPQPAVQGGERPPLGLAHPQVEGRSEALWVVPQNPKTTQSPCVSLWRSVGLGEETSFISFPRSLCLCASRASSADLLVVL